MTTITILAVTLLLFAAKDIAISIYINRCRRVLQHKIKVETTRAYLANLRIDLLNLVTTGQLDPNSDTFQMLYLVHTFILRRPDQYRELSKLFANTILSDKTPISISSLSRESKTWTPEVSDVVKRTARGLQLVIIYFSPLQTFAFIARHLFLGTSSSIRTYLQQHLYSRMDKRDPDLRNIRLVQNKFKELAI